MFSASPSTFCRLSVTHTHTHTCQPAQTHRRTHTDRTHRPAVPRHAAFCPARPRACPGTLQLQATIRTPIARPLLLALSNRRRMLRVSPETSHSLSSMIELLAFKLDFGIPIFEVVMHAEMRSTSHVRTRLFKTGYGRVNFVSR